MQKKNILFILPFFPYPLESGGHQAIFNGIKALVGKANIFIAFFDFENKVTNKEKKKLQKALNCKIQIFPLKDNQFLHLFPKAIQSLIISLWKIKQSIMNKDINSQITNHDRFFINELPKNTVSKIIQKYNISIVQCEMLRTAGFVNYLPTGVKTYFVHHEIGFVRRELETSTLKLSKSQIDLQKEKEKEISILNKFNNIITLSSIDTQKLKDAGVTKPIYTSFATIKQYTGEIPKIHDHHTLTFLGPSSHAPNKIGIEWFLGNCWEKLKKIDSQYKLQIIGKWSDTDMEPIQKKYKDISFLGFIQDLNKSIPGSIMIIPITIGSGIRMKILEAAQYNLPVVTTSIGIEGIPANQSKECFIADTPNDFINSILKCRQKNTRRYLVKNMNEFIRKYYSFDVFKNNRLAFYDLN